MTHIYTYVFGDNMKNNCHDLMSVVLCLLDPSFILPFAIPPHPITKFNNLGWV